MKKLRLKKNIKKILILIILSLIITSFVSKTFARYVSNISSNSEINVAQFGTLNLVEKINEEIQSNNSSSINIVENEIVLGEDIEKEVYVEFSNSEISSYLFLKINTKKWIYEEEKRMFSIKNNKSNLLYFYLGNDWNYMEEFSTNNSYVFYSSFDAKTDTYKKYDVLNKINVGILGFNDLENLSENEISFSTYTIQKSDEVNVQEAWNYLNK